MSPDSPVPELVRPAVERTDTRSTADAAATDSIAAPRERARRALRLVVAAATVVFVWLHRGEIPATAHQLRRADPLWVLAGVALVALFLAASGLLHQAGQRAAGWSLGTTRAVRLAASAAFLNVVTKSAGVAGAGCFVGEARRQGRARTPVVAGYAAAMLGSETAFLAVLGVAVLVLARGGELSAPVLVGAAVFGVYLGGRLALALGLGNVQALTARASALWARATTAMHRPPTRRHPPLADEVQEVVGLLRSCARRALPIVVWALVMEALGVAMVAASMAAVGLPSDPSRAVIVYSLAILFGIVGVVPGGLGVVEITTVATLVSLGADPSRAAAAVVIYRCFELWLPGLVGALAAARRPW
ncbi:MAG TPA: lysylphosphatidylglycerol synthase domain-containing protein [Acidimicrobiales bacterium]